MISEQLSAYQNNPASWSHWILEHFPFHPHDKILEIGCGMGDFWFDIHDRLPGDLKIFLTDASAAMVSAAKTKIPPFTELGYLVNDAESLCFQASSFNTVFANHVLHIIPDFKTALSEIWRVLQPGGLLIFSVLKKDHLKELGMVSLA